MIEQQEMLEEYKKILHRIKAYNEAISVMYWDLRTGAPKNAIDERSEVIGMLSADVFNLMTSEKMEKILNYFDVEENKQTLDNLTLKSLEESKREFERNKRIPTKMYKEYVILISKAENVWEEAKEKSDFNLFKPYLEEIVRFNKEFAELWGYQGNRYNSLLDKYELGMTVEQLDPLFKDLKDSLVPLVQKISETDSINTRFLHKEYNIAKQREFCNFLLKRMGFDFDGGRLDTTIHPFQITLNSGDIRVTTRFEENDLLFGLFSTMHEGGHAQYEQNISKDLVELMLNEGSSMGIHESQSRFWENIVGRSAVFWEFYYKELLALFPDQLADVPMRDFYRAVNEMRPSPIRIEADELTYNLHIMIRYEIEKELINGNLEVKDLPDFWNKKMEEYLGIVPQNDAEGILQDVHWSEGMFGYFPTYALGNIYAAQIYNQMKIDLPEFNDMLRLGNLISIKAWLNTKIHQYGKLKTPNEIMMEVTGEEINAKYLIDYLETKIRDVYSI